MTDNVYEFSFALAEEQNIEGIEMTLLGEIMQLSSKFLTTIPAGRYAVILDHLVKVNIFMMEQEAKRGKTLLKETIEETGNEDFIKFCEESGVFDEDVGE